MPSSQIRLVERHCGRSLFGVVTTRRALDGRDDDGGGGGIDGRTIALDISDTKRRFLSINDSSFFLRPRGFALFGRLRRCCCCGRMLVLPRSTGIGGDCRTSLPLSKLINSTWS